MIPKSMRSPIEQLRLPVLATLIRHLPVDQISIFVKDSGTMTVDDKAMVKDVFMSSNNILRWVLDTLMTERSAFQHLERIHALYAEKSVLVDRFNEAIKK